MSYSDAERPECAKNDRDGISVCISGKERDIGDMTVRRILPSLSCRSVGPFVFWDEMGPAVFEPGGGLTVRPHPHINLATVTYVFEGEIMHRDSLGVEQPIQPGAVNWMTAGKGIVHSERTRPELRAEGAKLHGIQAWLALPKEFEEIEPSFQHHPKEELPTFQRGGAEVALIAGEGFGHQSPVSVLSPLCYADIRLKTGASLQIPEEYSERAAYVVSGILTVGSKKSTGPEMLVFAKGAKPTLVAESDCRLMFLAGESMPEPRYLWWNFVSSDKKRIEKAKEDWQEGRFPVVPGDEDESIPLPK